MRRGLGHDIHASSEELPKFDGQPDRVEPRAARIHEQIDVARERRFVPGDRSKDTYLARPVASGEPTHFLATSADDMFDAHPAPVRWDSELGDLEVPRLAARAAPDLIRAREPIVATPIAVGGFHGFPHRRK